MLFAAAGLTVTYVYTKNAVHDCARLQQTRLRVLNEPPLWLQVNTGVESPGYDAINKRDVPLRVGGYCCVWERAALRCSTHLIFCKLVSYPRGKVKPLLRDAGCLGRGRLEESNRPTNAPNKWCLGRLALVAVLL